MSEFKLPYKTVSNAEFEVIILHYFLIPSSYLFSARCNCLNLIMIVHMLPVNFLKISSFLLTGAILFLQSVKDKLGQAARSMGPTLPAGMRLLTGFVGRIPHGRHKFLSCYIPSLLALSHFVMYMTIKFGPC